MQLQYISGAVTATGQLIVQTVRFSAMDCGDFVFVARSLTNAVKAPDAAFLCNRCVAMSVVFDGDNTVLTYEAFDPTPTQQTAA